jgi:ABC-type taurine transport system substrate-binding protein
VCNECVLAIWEPAVGMAVLNGRVYVDSCKCHAWSFLSCEVYVSGRFAKKVLDAVWEMSDVLWC